MARNDEGEFELILGNSQLISVFLIVVILLGVFFSMGYIVGRNSVPSATAGNTIKVEPQGHPTTGTADQTASSSQPPPAVEDKPATPETKPETPPPAAEKTEPKPRETRTTAPPPQPERKQETPKPETPKPETPSERAATTTVDQPAAGQYWQVAAAPHSEAEIVATAINRKGLHALLAPASKPGLFRVLVGPMADTATAAKTRTQLEGMGFKNPILHKY